MSIKTKHEAVICRRPTRSVADQRCCFSDRFRGQPCDQRLARAAAALEPHQRSARAARHPAARAHRRAASSRNTWASRFPLLPRRWDRCSTPGCLEEFDDVMTGPGRPAKRLRLSREKSQVVGVTVDVRTCEVAAAGFDGVVREDTKQSFPTPQQLRRTAGRHRRAREIAPLRRCADPVHRHQRGRPRRLPPAGDSPGRQLALPRRQEARPGREPSCSAPNACSFTTRTPCAWPNTCMARPAISIASPCSICAPASAWA